MVMITAADDFRLAKALLLRAHDIRDMVNAVAGLTLMTTTEVPVLFAGILRERYLVLEEAQLALRAHRGKL